jgi:hypothetical protein
MTITRQETVPKVKLPAANLHLDDLEEIISILKPEGEEQPPKLRFTVNDLICDSMDDLHKIGKERIGRTSSFTMDVGWQKSCISDELRVTPEFRADLSVGGSNKRRAWVMEQIYELFKRRIDWLGRFPWLVVSTFFLLYLVFFQTVMHFVHQAVGREGPVHWLFVFGLGLVMGYPLFRAWVRSQRSAVILQSYSEAQGSWFQRHRDQIAVAALISLISTTIGVLGTLFVQRVLH